jgi:glycosyltransferase involved in cell wall biosynthesis
MSLVDSRSYIIITPAWNEEGNIERLIRCVISQTVLPVRWVIVSDGSTDRTDDIVRVYAEQYDWIRLVRLPEHRDRQFAAKVVAFNAGYKTVNMVQHEIIGNLDADLSFDKAYFEFLIHKFEENPNLGVAGTPFVENDGYSSITDSFEGGKHVAGGCQLFRRACFDDIDGYIPNKEGGIDWIAVTTARMKGWTTQSFPQKNFYHHRSLGTGESNKFKSNFNYGRKDYYLGNHPLWEAVRILYRLTKWPYIVGGLTTLSGYLWAALARTERPISSELMAFHRDEEMRKLKAIFEQIARFRKIDKYELKF